MASFQRVPGFIPTFPTEHQQNKTYVGKGNQFFWGRATFFGSHPREAFEVPGSAGPSDSRRVAKRASRQTSQRLVKPAVAFFSRPALFSAGSSASPLAPIFAQGSNHKIHLCECRASSREGMSAADSKQFCTKPLDRPGVFLCLHFYSGEGSAWLVSSWFTDFWHGVDLLSDWESWTGALATSRHLKAAD